MNYLASLLIQHPSILFPRIEYFYKISSHMIFGCTVIRISILIQQEAGWMGLRVSLDAETKKYPLWELNLSHAAH